MSVTVPHYLLFTESSPHRPGRYLASAAASLDVAAGHWRFVLESTDGSVRVEAEDDEPRVSGERLELLAVVRGLEAIEQPARVTLLSSSRYVLRGIRFGLENWRDNEWQWESFGQMLPVKNRDLWERLDRALRIHQVACRSWLVKDDEDEGALPCPQAVNVAEAAPTSTSPATCTRPGATSHPVARPSRRRRAPPRRATRRAVAPPHPAARWWQQVVRMIGGEIRRSGSLRMGA